LTRFVNNNQSNAIGVVDFLKFQSVWTSSCVQDFSHGVGEARARLRAAFAWPRIRFYRQARRSVGGRETHLEEKSPPMSKHSRIDLASASRRARGMVSRKAFSLQWSALPGREKQTSLLAFSHLIGRLMVKGGRSKSGLKATSRRSVRLGGGWGIPMEKNDPNANGGMLIQHSHQKQALLIMLVLNAFEAGFRISPASRISSPGEMAG